MSFITVYIEMTIDVRFFISCDLSECTCHWTCFHGCLAYHSSGYIRLV